MYWVDGWQWMMVWKYVWRSVSNECSSSCTITDKRNCRHSRYKSYWRDVWCYSYVWCLEVTLVLLNTCELLYCITLIWLMFIICYYCVRCDDEKRSRSGRIRIEKWNARSLWKTSIYNYNNYIGPIMIPDTLMTHHCLTLLEEHVINIYICGGCHCKMTYYLYEKKLKYLITFFRDQLQT